MQPDISLHCETTNAGGGASASRGVPACKCYVPAFAGLLITPITTEDGPGELT